MELFKASRQWAQRPDDERFSSLKELHAVVSKYRSQAAESTVSYKSLGFTASKDADVHLTSSKSGLSAKLTHWAFGQLCQRAGAPPSYLRGLPAPLASSCLNNGFKALQGGDETVQLMFHDQGGLLLRAATTTRYTRIWNADVTFRLLNLNSEWRVPPARPARQGQAGVRKATQNDVLHNKETTGAPSINIGDLIAPAGLYASDHDMFVFMVNEDRRIKDGTPEGLSRGFFCWNSEVGAASFGLTAFLYRHVCGNHIIWGAQDVTELRLRHIGNADARAFNSIKASLTSYSNASVSDEEAKIKQARKFELGKTKEEVLDRIFRLRVPILSKQRAEDAYQYAVMNSDQDGSPRSAWGLAQGITRLSQDSTYADDRVALDRSVGKVLQIAF